MPQDRRFPPPWSVDEPDPKLQQHSSSGTPTASFEYAVQVLNTPLILVLGHEFLGLSKTCAKLGIVFWNYLGSRLAAANQRDIPYLPQLVRYVTTG